MTSPLPTRHFRFALGVITIAALYFASGKLGLMLAFVHPSATAVWPPTGISLASFLILGYRVWPAILLGAFLVNLTTAGTIATSFGIAVGNTLEGFVGAYLVNRFARGSNAFDRPRDIFRFAILAAGLSTTISASVGVTSLSLGGFAEWARYGSIWTTWWLGDMAGALIVTPPILLLILRRDYRWRTHQAIEAVMFLFVLFMVGQAVFGGWLPFETKNYPLDFLLLPILTWASFRFEQREVACFNLLLSAVAIRGTLLGYGPFVRATPHESLLLLQLFLAMSTLMSIAVAAVVSERRELIRALEDALAHVKTLKGLLPICAWCKKIRDDGGYWQEVDAYIHKHSDVAFSHGICPECLNKIESQALARRRGPSATGRS